MGWPLTVRIFLLLLPTTTKLLTELHLGTCAVPRFHPLERPLLDSDKVKSDLEWDRLYEIVEPYVRKSNTQYTNESIRHELVLRALQRRYKEEGRKFEPLPLAAERKTRDFVDWSSANTIFNMEDQRAGTASFELRSNTRCTRLERDEANNITCAQVRYLLAGEERDYKISAKIFILAAGAIANPQASPRSQ